MTSHDRRRWLLLAALGFALLDFRGAPEPPVASVLKQWLATWTGIGLIVRGMERQGYDFHLSQTNQGWRATFYRRLSAGLTPLEHRVLRFWPTPFREVQEAAWETLRAQDTTIGQPETVR